MKLEDFQVGDHVVVARRATHGQGKYEHNVFKKGDVLEIKTVGEYPLGTGVTNPTEVVAVKVVDDIADEHNANWVGIECLEPLYIPVTQEEEDEMIRSILKGLEV